MLSNSVVYNMAKDLRLEAGRLVDGINIWSDFPSPGRRRLETLPHCSRPCADAQTYDQWDDLQAGFPLSANETMYFEMIQVQTVPHSYRRHCFLRCSCSSSYLCSQHRNESRGPDLALVSSLLALLL